MKHNKVTKQKLYIIANQIAKEGLIPSHRLLRNRLGGGSNSTIQKYFRLWKKERFGIVNNNEVNTNNLNESENLLEKYRILVQTYNKQITQNEHYSQELINTEKANVVLKDKNHQLQTQLQTVQLELKELKNINNALKQVTTEIKNKLENNDNKTIQNLQQNIDNLKTELKKLNETSLEALRDACTKSHEVLMQEKLIGINLQAKIDSLYKELIDSKKQLNDATLRYQVQTQALLRQINEQQKIIQDHIGFENLRELVGEEVMLHFNNKPGVAYGK